MHDRQVSATTVAGWIGWTLGLTFIVGDFFIVSDDIGHVGILLAAGGAMAHVRGMLVQHCLSTKAAFDLGRETGREEARIPLQRV